MSRLMQLSSLYIRGAIATQTMAGLTTDQVRRINDIVVQIENDQSIAADRHMFIHQLGATIKCDYRSDPIAALQEFRIAIWRATVHLLHHRSYSYICSLCGATEYNTSTGKPKAFDRQYKSCPKCERGLVSTFVTDLILGHDGQAVRVETLDRDTGFTAIDDDGNVLLKDMTREEMDEYYISPISPVHGPRKVEDPEAILSDETQRSKWYVTWIWNYFRQILNENIIKTHNKHQVEISGPADQIAFQIIINQLKKIKHRFHYDEGISLGLSNLFDISFDGLMTESSFTDDFFVPLTYEFQQYNVAIKASSGTISIRRTADVESISTYIETEDQVISLSFNRPDDDDSKGTWSDVVEYKRTDRGTGTIYDGRIEDMISDEAMYTVRHELRDENARRAFDIFSQTGDSWRKFSSVWGTQQARKAHIAQFLQVSPKQIDTYKQQIAVQCQIHGLR
jgi:hypothetical protein